MSCGTIEQDGRVTHAVAAGGYSDGNYVDTVFIYDVEEGTWTTGLTYLHSKKPKFRVNHTFLYYRKKSSHARLSRCLSAVPRELLDTWRILQDMQQQYA